MMRFAAVAAILCMVPAGLGFGPPTFVESSRALAPLYAGQVAAIQTFHPPTVSAASALLSEETGNFKLFARDARARRPMASLTKIMTALLALERGRLDERATVRVDAADLVDNSVMGLRPGEELTLEDLLYGLLLPSGNDAAVAIAEHIAGSVPQFVVLMNSRAAALGMNDTHFTNPHGLDDPAHYSTAEDLLVLAGAAMRNATFAKIVGTPERAVVGKLATYQLRNTNRLLAEYEGVQGIKTGDTDAAGQCLVVVAQRGDERLYSVVLGSAARFDDTKALLDYFYSSFLCRHLEPAASSYDLLWAGPPEAAASLPGVVGQDGGLSPSSGQDIRSLNDRGEGPWDCRPAWQARWWRTETRYTSSGLPPEVVYYVGDQPIARPVKTR